VLSYNHTLNCFTVDVQLWVWRSGSNLFKPGVQNLIPLSISTKSRCRIRKVPGWNFGSETGSLSSLLGFFSLLTSAGIVPWSRLWSLPSASVQNLHPIIWRDVIRTVEKALLSKARIKQSLISISILCRSRCDLNLRLN